MSIPPLPRRDFLAAGVAGGAALLGSRGSAAAAAPPALIDPHTHFYDPTRPGGVPWPAADSPLHRRVLPSDWLAEAKPAGITETIVVEASPLVEDNQWLLDLVRGHPCLVGVVGRLPLGAAGCTALVDRFAANAKFRGVRVKGDEVVKGFDDPAFMSDLERLAAHGLVPDVNWGPVFDAADGLATRFPRMQVLVEHMAGAAIGGDRPDPAWVEGLLRVGGRPNTWLKVSGLVESAASRAKLPRAPDDPGHYRPWLDVAWKAFGPDRLIFASNWPVCEWAADYTTVVGIVKPWVAAHGPRSWTTAFSSPDRTIRTSRTAVGAASSRSCCRAMQRATSSRRFILSGSTGTSTFGSGRSSLAKIGLMPTVPVETSVISVLHETLSRCRRRRSHSRKPEVFQVDRLHRLPRTRFGHG